MPKCRGLRWRVGDPEAGEVAQIRSTPRGGQGFRLLQVICVRYLVRGSQGWNGWRKTKAWHTLEGDGLQHLLSVTHNERNPQFDIDLDYP